MLKLFHRNKIILITSDNFYDKRFGGLSYIIELLYPRLIKKFKVYFPDNFYHKNDLLFLDFINNFVKFNNSINYDSIFKSIIRQFILPKKFPTFDLGITFDWQGIILLCNMIYLGYVKKSIISFHLPHLSSLFLVGQMYSNPFEFIIGEMIGNIEILGAKLANATQFVSNIDSLPFRFISKKVYVIHNGLNPEKYKVVFSEFENLRQRNRILFIGRLVPQKGVQFILDENFEIPNDITFVFVIPNVGNNEDLLSSLYKKKEKYPNNIEIRRNLWGVDKLIEFAKADAVIYPSIYEPFGLTCLEALMSKRILIASGATGMGEWLRDGCYIKCEPSQDGIIKALDIYKNLSEKERENLISNGYELSLNYTEDKMVNGYFKMIEEVLYD